MPGTVIYGPAGCGKTLTALKLQQHYGCPALVDEWDGRTPLEPHTLALTNAPPPYHATAARILPYADALQEMALAARSVANG